MYMRNILQLSVCMHTCLCVRVWVHVRVLSFVFVDVSKEMVKEYIWLGSG